MSTFTDRAAGEFCGSAAGRLAEQRLVIRVLRRFGPARRIGEVRPAEEDVVDLPAVGTGGLRVGVEEPAPRPALTSAPICPGTRLKSPPTMTAPRPARLLRARAAAELCRYFSRRPFVPLPVTRWRGAGEDGPAGRGAQAQDRPVLRAEVGQRQHLSAPDGSRREHRVAEAAAGAAGVVPLRPEDTRHLPGTPLEPRLEPPELPGADLVQGQDGRPEAEDPVGNVLHDAVPAVVVRLRRVRRTLRLPVPNVWLHQSNLRNNSDNSMAGRWMPAYGTQNLRPRTFASSSGTVVGLTQPASQLRTTPRGAVPTVGPWHPSKGGRPCSRRLS